MGIYLSPWDRHEKTYGSGKPYDDYFCAQLEEVLTGYGEMYAVWFDGACGEGPNGKKQVYDFDRYYALIRSLQPNACISVAGPDVRWCGNEAGETRPSEWSVLPCRMRDTEKIAAASQQSDDDKFRLRPLKASDADLGSRAALENEKELIWYPAEVNTSIRPGWFYHDVEDAKVKPLEKLLDIYEKSVGGNANFLLNIPPDTEGRIHKEDCIRLKEMGASLSKMFSRNLLDDSAAEIRADSEEQSHSAASLIRDDETFWRPAGETERAQIFIRFSQTKRVGRIVLAEQIRESQRIEAFSVYAGDGNGKETKMYEGTTVGWKKICAFPALQTASLRIVIEASRLYPTLRFLGIYGDAL
jgi:alpha-L-fucosidase